MTYMIFWIMFKESKEKEHLLLYLDCFSVKKKAHKIDWVVTGGELVK